MKSEYGTWDPEWPTTKIEVFRDFGFAAFVAQMLESILLSLLVVADHAGKIKIEKSKKKKNLDTFDCLSPKTMGQLIRELEKHDTSENLKELLQEALDARNHLTHHFFSSHASNFKSDEGRGLMLKELEQLRFKIGRVQHMMEGFMDKYVESVYGFTSEQVRAMYEDFLERKQKGEPDVAHNSGGCAPSA